jgi:integrase
VVRPAVARANEQLTDSGHVLIPDGLTPRSLRRTFASLLYAIGEPPPVVMAEMGHTDPALALRIYAEAMRRDPGENERLSALVEGSYLADAGSRAADSAVVTSALDAA